MGGEGAASVPFRVPPPFADTPAHCTMEYCINERGYKIVQLWQEIPVLAPLYSEFESGTCSPTRSHRRPVPQSGLSGCWLQWAEAAFSTDAQCNLCFGPPAGFKQGRSHRRIILGTHARRSIHGERIGVAARCQLASELSPGPHCRTSHCNSRIRERLWVCVPITVIYLVLIFGGQHYMRNRPAWDVRSSLICWNWLCSIFSLIGALRVVPHALYACDSMISPRL